MVAEIHADPKGSVAKWIVNMFQKGWPHNTITSLREQVKKPDIRDHAHLKEVLTDKGYFSELIRKKDALEYHSLGRPGKIEVVSTKPCTTQRDLSLAYSPAWPNHAARSPRIDRSSTRTPRAATWSR